MKKFISLVLALGMVLAMSGISIAAEFAKPTKYDCVSVKTLQLDNNTTVVAKTFLSTPQLVNSNGLRSPDTYQRSYEESLEFYTTAGYNHMYTVAATGTIQYSPVYQTVIMNGASARVTSKSISENIKIIIGKVTGNNTASASITHWIKGSTSTTSSNMEVTADYNGNVTVAEV